GGFGFGVGGPAVRGVAVGLADAAGVVVGVEEVHVDAGAVGLEGGEELPRPRRLGGAGGVVLLGEPYRVDDDVVLDVAAGVGGGVARGPGDRAAPVEHRRVRPRGAGPVGVLGGDVDDPVGQPREVGRLPVVVPAVRDGVIDAALVVDVEGGPGQVCERGPELAERTDGALPVLDGSGVAAGDGDGRPEVQSCADPGQRW